MNVAMRPVRLALPLAILIALWPKAALEAQTAAPRPDDVASPEPVVEAMYRTIDRRPGEPFDWDRLRTLHLPERYLAE